MPQDAMPVSPPGFRWRLVFAVLGATGMAIIYGLKVNLSVTIVAMLNHTHLEALKEAEMDHAGGHGSGGAGNESDLLTCIEPKTEHGVSQAEEDGPFSWTEPQQGLVLGSYFWGYVVTQIPGGRMADSFGGKWAFLIAVLINVVCTLLSPVCSYAGFEYLILMRVLEGLGGGLTFPAMNVLVSKWAPAGERSFMSSLVYGGTALGTVISIPSAGIIAGTICWEAVFYIHGGLALVWCVLWAVLVSDTPSNHRFISAQEREYILTPVDLGSDAPAGGGHGAPISTGEKLPIPWKKILTSAPVWAIIIAHTCNNFGWYMLLVELPLFMRTGLGFNIKENAGLSAVPFLANWLFSIVYSNRMDWAMRNKYVSTTMARKISMIIASLVPAGCLLGVCFSGCDKTAVVVLMIVATMFYGAMFSGVFSNHVDIASNFAGLLMGCSNMAATIPGFAVPAFVGMLTHGSPGLGPWHVTFYTTAAILLFELVVYTLLASGVEQDWNRPQKRTDGDQHEKEALSA